MNKKEDVKKKKTIQKKIKKLMNEGIGLLNSRYTLEEEIGVGGLSRVYRAKDIYCEYFNDKRELAIKIPSKKLLSKKDIAAFVYSEFAYLRQINHENIVKVLDFGIDIKTELPYIVLEYLEGDLLYDLPLHKMSKEFKIALFENLFEAISYIHKKDIIHADINPKNIMVSLKEKITLFDFGISQYNNDRKGLCLEYENAKAYNPKYSAPEILKGKEPSVHSDLFSFACVVYEVFSEVLPFKESSLDLEKNPLSKKNCSNKIPYTLRKWIISALNIDPLRRKKDLPFIHTF